jgi:hypothetical protein
MSDDITFANGFIAKRSPDAPDWKLTNLSIKVEEAVEFLNTHNKAGWVNLEILVAKSSGKPYVKLDKWEPTKQEEYATGAKQAREAMSGSHPAQNIPRATGDTGVPFDDIPF